MLRKLQKNPQKTEITVKMKKRGKSAKNSDRGKNGKTAKKAQNTAIAVNIEKRRKSAKNRDRGPRMRRGARGFLFVRRGAGGLKFTRRGARGIHFPRRGAVFSKKTAPRGHPG